jgi:hypothetical protein
MGEEAEASGIASGGTIVFSELRGEFFAFVEAELLAEERAAGSDDGSAVVAIGETCGGAVVDVVADVVVDVAAVVVGSDVGAARGFDVSPDGSVTFPSEASVGCPVSSSKERFDERWINSFNEATRSPVKRLSACFTSSLSIS